MKIHVLWKPLTSLHVGKTMPCLPPMSGNGTHTTYKHGDDWGIIPWSNENPMGFVDSPAGESMLLVGGLNPSEK